MSNQSPFVKFVIWVMVFLMSIGFAALVITPFMSGGLFGSGDGSDATQKLLDEARSDVRTNHCTDTKTEKSKAIIKKCREGYMQLGAAYQTLATSSIDTNDTTQTAPPKDYQRNIDRAGDAYEAAYKLDVTNDEAAQQYASYLRDAGKYERSIAIWEGLIKRNPKNEDYLIQLAYAQQSNNNLDLAIATYTDFLKKFPDSGQKTSIEEQIADLKKQKKDQAAQQAAGGAAGSNLPINVGG
jgi:tetratricopeptide (TPR) repeat protein